ncbi:probable 4-coumarate--CoA ligase 1 [Malaya genurostris]|uniref:probable 4-coumarate--CoA ligase 1 n=1 Tax=Malaya genurostris TaxID=325434 RepID=UPI0026F39F86|nr:probable 4-coumarate--CoA ligase 1 [Malaya genurostris]
MRLIRGVSTFYDPTRKIWSDLRMLDRNSDKVLQISADDDGREVTGSELLLRTIRIAQNLLRKELVDCADKNCLVAMAVRNGEHTAPVLFACFALGIPVNTLDPSFQRDDFAHMLETVRPKLIFCDAETLEEMRAACELAKIAPKIVVMGEKVSGFDHVEDLLLATEDEENFVPVHFEDPAKQLAILVCSSGTTGRSKAVGLSHAICIAHVVNFLECRPSDRLFAFSSLYWLSGLVVLLMGSIWGATRIITRRGFSSALAIEIVERFQVTVALYPPSQVNAIIADPTANSESFDSMRLAFSGGGAVSTTLKRQLDKLLPGRSSEIAYGFSEIGFSVAFTINSPPRKNVAEIYREGAVGFLQAGTEVKIVDDHGKLLGIDQEGEILVKARYAFLGYYGNDEATGIMMDSEGWLHSGDIGRFDKDGLLYIVDRKKDIIKYGNYQVSPSEIENVVLSVPGVVSVCVVGIPVEGNDLAAALVVPTDSNCSSDEVLRAVEQKLPSYKHLRGGVYFTDKLPMTSSGKILRREAKNVVLQLRNN